jgi:hypothetical protein
VALNVTKRSPECQGFGKTPGVGGLVRKACLIAIAFTFVIPPAAGSAVLDAEARARFGEYGRQPLRFERNDGQVNGPARYLSHGPGYTVFVLPTEMVLSLRRGKDYRRRLGMLPPKGTSQRPSGAGILRVKLLKARRGAQVEGLERLPGDSNYFIGSDPKMWRTAVPSYATVRCRGIYPGIDLMYHGRDKELEYDFVVAPGSDPTRIRLGFEGAQLRLDDQGNLVVHMDGGEIVQRAPRLYEEAGSGKRPVRGRWVLRGESEAGFEVTAYDTRHTLVIDPVLAYSTYLGGNSIDYGLGIAVDSSGSAYITGYTYSTDFPTLNPYQLDPPLADVFVTKLSSSGNDLVYSTYIGGGNSDFGYAIAIDGSGSAYVTGETNSSDFPIQNPYQGGQCCGAAFVTKLSPSGDSLVYSTYLGGHSSDYGHAITVDGSGNAYVVGATSSSDFPTQNPFQTYQGATDVFVSKLSAAGNSLLYSTLLGGYDGDYGYAIAVDATGSAYGTGVTFSPNFPTQVPYQLVGAGVFVTKLSPAGSDLVYSIYLGGGGGTGIAVDGSGSAYVTGSTSSPEFPTVNPYQTYQGGGDAFLTKLSPAGSSLEYSTYLGGGSADYGNEIAVDSAGHAYVTGQTFSADFPLQDPYQTYQGDGDAFVTKFSPAGTALLYSTCVGGNRRDTSIDIAADSATDIALDGSGNAYITGQTFSTNFPTQDPYQSNQPSADAFVTKLMVRRGLDFFTVLPCRLIDTRRGPSPYGGPALAAGGDRAFVVVGQCGIPVDARAISVNLAVTAPASPGYLRLYPTGGNLTLASTINYAQGQTRSNNAIVGLYELGAISVRCLQTSGTTHFILDITGYFR